MSRYDNTDINKVKYGKNKGISKRSTKFYKKILESNNDMTVMTQFGDRLDLLAHQFYGDQYLWWYIARANNIKFNNVEPGTILRIPPYNDTIG
jgi:nucleoid-associated protein YgaU